MNCVVFKWSARFGHFLKAEANASAPSYPIPPRTALLGMIGAVLGLSKDEPQVELADCRIAVGGKAARRHWHSANLRKKLPAPLPKVVTGKSPGSSAEPKNTIIKQEWLVDPSFEVIASLPAPWQEDFISRLKEQRWHFCPCMGLSEMIADLVFVEAQEAVPLPDSCHQVSTVFRREEGSPDLMEASAAGLSIQSLRLPRHVGADRSFTHDAYLREINCKPVPVESSKVWRVGDRNVMWL